MPRHTKHPRKTRDDRAEIAAAQRRLRRAADFGEPREDTGQPAPGHASPSAHQVAERESDEYREWRAANGIPNGPAPSRRGAEDARREAMERWHRLAAEKRATAKHAADHNGRRRALARAEYFEQRGDALFRELNEPHVEGDPILVNPYVCVCEYEAADANDLWTHKASCWT